MTAKPHAEIREALVKLRGMDRPAPLKAAAEVLITTIDNLEKYGDDSESTHAFQHAYVLFSRAAAPERFPQNLLSPGEIAKLLEIGDGGTPQ